MLSANRRVGTAPHLETPPGSFLKVLPVIQRNIFSAKRYRAFVNIPKPCPRGFADVLFPPPDGPTKAVTSALGKR